jgi:DnaJ-class molecular chaperone
MSQDPDAHGKFSEMTAAYQVLKDPQKRAAYDIERTMPAPDDLMRSNINRMDPLYEAMRRHQEEQMQGKRRTSFWTTHEEWFASCVCVQDKPVTAHR